MVEMLNLNLEQKNAPADRTRAKGETVMKCSDSSKLIELKRELSDIFSCTDLKKESANSFCGPCPVCGGNDRFVYKTDTEKCWCRKCHEKTMDIIDFHCWKDGKTVSDLMLKYLRTGRNEYTAPTPMDLFSRRGLAEKAINLWLKPED